MAKDARLSAESLAEHDLQYSAEACHPTLLVCPHWRVVTMRVANEDINILSGYVKLLYRTEPAEKGVVSKICSNSKICNGTSSVSVVRILRGGLAEDVSL